MIHHRMYGDLIVGLLAVMTLFSLIHEYILLVRKETDVPFHVALLGPSVICIHEVYILLVCARSFLYQSRVASYLVFLSISMFSQLTSSYQWPAPVASNLTSTFCVQLCVLLANTPHAVFTKMVLGLVGTMHVIFLSSASPLNSLQVDLPNVIIYVGNFFVPCIRFALCMHVADDSRLCHLAYTLFC